MTILRTLIWLTVTAVGAAELYFVAAPFALMARCYSPAGCL